MNTLIKLGLVSLALIPSLLATANDFTHIDYIPTYRTLERNTIITHIKYTEQELVFYMCYVAGESSEQIAMEHNNWNLSARSAGSQSYDVSARTVQNVRVNNTLQVLNASDSKESIFTAKKGDIVSFQLHFLRPEKEVRLVNLKGNGFGAKALEYQDIMLKEASNRYLGYNSDPATTLKLFYAKCAYVAHPELVSFVTLEEELEKQRIIQAEKSWIHNSMKPISYEPKLLNSAKDLECSKRVILQDILFEDNSAEYKKQVDANQTLGIIVAYMTEYPNAKIVLHGHTDVLGDAEKNIEISQERVATIKRSLRLAGVVPQRVITVAYGGTQPLAKYTHGGAPNRRVEVEIFCGVEDANGVQVIVSETQSH